MLWNPPKPRDGYLLPRRIAKAALRAADAIARDARRTGRREPRFLLVHHDWQRVTGVEECP